MYVVVGGAALSRLRKKKKETKGRETSKVEIQKVLASILLSRSAASFGLLLVECLQSKSKSLCLQSSLHILILTNIQSGSGR